MFLKDGKNTSSIPTFSRAAAIVGVHKDAYGKNATGRRVYWRRKKVVICSISSDIVFDVNIMGFIL